MNIHDAFPSRFIRAADLKGSVARVKIGRIEYEDVGNDQKLVLYFENKEKGLVVNKTNGMAIAAEYGPETDGWVGATVEMFAMKVPFQGQQVDSIRLRFPKQAPARPTIVSNARARAEMVSANEAPPDTGFDEIRDDPDDDIPF